MIPGGRIWTTFDSSGPFGGPAGTVQGKVGAEIGGLAQRLELLIAAILLVAALMGDLSAQDLEVILPAPDWVASHQFTDILAVRELELGVLIADRVEGLFFLSWDDTNPTQIGRTGRGPGEFVGIGRLFPLDSDSTLFVDSRYGRWLLLKDSQIVSTVSEQHPLNASLGSQIIGADGAGRVMSERWFLIPARPGPPHSPDSVFLVVGDRNTQRLDTVARLGGEGPRGAAMLPALAGSFPRVVGHNPLISRDLAVLFPDGWIAIARADPYRVDWRRPDGTWVLGKVLPRERIEVDDEEKCAAMARTLGQGSPCDPSVLSEWPQYMPPFVRDRIPSSVILPVPSGRLVVERTPQAQASIRRYDVIDRVGDLVGVLNVAAQERVVGFGLGAIYIVSSDQVGLQTLTRRPWPAMQ